MTVQFSQIVKEIVESTGENYLDYEVEDIIEHLSIVLQSHLKVRNSVRIKGIGVFSVKEYERVWTNPCTKEKGLINSLSISVRATRELKRNIKEATRRSLRREEIKRQKQLLKEKEDRKYE